jgi:hypothetical protein
VCVRERGEEEGGGGDLVLGIATHKKTNGHPIKVEFPLLVAMVVVVMGC